MAPSSVALSHFSQSTPSLLRAIIASRTVRNPPHKYTTKLGRRLARSGEWEPPTLFPTTHTHTHSCRLDCNTPLVPLYMPLDSSCSRACRSLFSPSCLRPVQATSSHARLDPVWKALVPVAGVVLPSAALSCRPTGRVSSLVLRKLSTTRRRTARARAAEGTHRGRSRAALPAP